jgi:hypothetical protein
MLEPVFVLHLDHFRFFQLAGVLSLYWVHFMVWLPVFFFAGVPVQEMVVFAVLGMVLGISQDFFHVARSTMAAATYHGHSNAPWPQPHMDCFRPQMGLPWFGNTRS